MKREDDFETRRQHLRGLSDDELAHRFWSLVGQIVDPLVADARTHTSPSIERSVLLRMGFSSLEASALVERMHAKGLLVRGAGRLVLDLAQREGMTVRDAGLALLGGRHWEGLVR